MSDYFSQADDSQPPSRAGEASSNARDFVTPQRSVSNLRDAQQPEGAPGTPGLSRFPSYPTGAQNPAPPMRIRRLPSLPNTSAATASNSRPATAAEHSEAAEQEGRRRSFSDPSRSLNVPDTRPHLRPQASAASGLPTVQEERNSFQIPMSDRYQFNETLGAPQPPGRLRSFSNAARSFMGRDRRASTVSRDSQSSRNVRLSDPGRENNYESEVVDYLDVVDPEVSTLTTLNNVQNSLFVPYLGRLYNRQPTYELSQPTELDREATELAEARIREDNKLQRPETIQEQREDGSEATSMQEAEASESLDQHSSSLARMSTIKSTLSGMSEGHNYAVLPHGVRLEGWSEQEKEELNDHVRHLLHSRRSAFKRSMRAFGKYVRKPMGFFVTFYAFTITFWGAAWVIFLIGWIHVGDRREFWIDICDQILTALLVIIGISLLPWRLADTFHMIYIAHYHYKIWSIRKDRGMPALPDQNDLPDTDPKNKPLPQWDKDIEADASKGQQRPQAVRHESVVLQRREMRILRHHQQMFAKSHTFYKPHETATHRAFSIKLLITVVVLLDFHSFFQIALASTTWAIDYRVRGRVTTTVILAFSLSCNIIGGIIISIGDKRSRKKEVFEQIFRQARTEEAMKKIEKKSGRPRFMLRPSVQNLARLKEEEHLRQEVEAAEIEAAARVSKSAGPLA